MMAYTFAILKVEADFDNTGHAHDSVDKLGISTNKCCVHLARGFKQSCWSVEFTRDGKDNAVGGSLKPMVTPLV